jgi:hypothetical protein
LVQKLNISVSYPGREGQSKGLLRVPALLSQLDFFVAFEAVIVVGEAHFLLDRAAGTQAAVFDFDAVAFGGFRHAECQFFAAFKKGGTLRTNAIVLGF